MTDVIIAQPARVYLQGKNALQPFITESEDIQIYAIGSEETNLIIQDHRPVAIQAAQRAMQGYDVEEFAQIFSTPAYVEICEEESRIVINLYDTHETSETILWIGVIHEHHLPIHYMPWYKFIPLSDDSIAFAAVVED